jgi:hypothetical protein
MRCVVISTDEVTYVSYCNQWHAVRELPSGEREWDIVLPVGVLVVNIEDAPPLSYDSEYGDNRSWPA